MGGCDYYITLLKLNDKELTMQRPGAASEKALKK